MILPRVKLKKREGSDSYFINDGKRISAINESFLSNSDLSVIGVVKENERTWFIRSDDVENGDVIWVEATFDEVARYQETGKKDFLKEDLPL